MGITQIIAENLQISEETASNFLDNFDVKPEKIRYCGRVNVDVIAEIIHGTEYWIADCDGYIYWGQRNPQCSQWNEETANAIGVPWGDYEEEMEEYQMHTGCAFCRKNHPVDNVIKFNKMSNAFYVCEECYSSYKRGKNNMKIYAKKIGKIVRLCVNGEEIIFIGKLSDAILSIAPR